MTLTIELSPHIEALLLAKAAQQGQDVTIYAAHVLENDAQRNTTNTTRSALDALDTYLATLPDNRVLAGLEPLPDHAVEDAYRVREDALL